MSAGRAAPLAWMLAAVPADPDSARAVAREILSEEPFLQRRTPRPFAAFLERLREWFIDPIERLFRSIARTLPDVGSPPWLLLALIVVAVAVVVTVHLARDRSRERYLRARSAVEAEAGMSAPELERLADAAEARGDLTEALRLRFRAGLVRLDRLGAIDLRPALTNAAVARRLGSRRFDALADDFDEVVYGGRAATPGDIEEARAEWPRLLEEAARP